MGLGVMPMKGYSILPAPALLRLHHQIILCQNQDTHCGGGRSYSFVEKQLVYSTTLANWAKNLIELVFLKINLNGYTLT